MELSFDKIKPGIIYCNSFFAFLPKWNWKTKDFFWLCRVRREILMKNGKVQTHYSKGYSGGVVYITDKTVKFDYPIFFKKNIIWFKFW